MRARQYIYTLCKTKSDGNVGYACYSKSDGLDDKECEEIQKYTTYNYSKELPGKGTQDELKVHPQNFCSFKLSDGKVCIAFSTYLGQYFDTKMDERMGNYISHVLVFEKDGLCQYPITLFMESCFKSYITPEELNLPYPYPKLPEVEITSCGNVISIDRVINFLESREAKFELLISSFIKAKEEKLLLYLNDTQENIVFWIAALQMLLPVSMCTEVSFATYKYYDKAVFHNTINKLPYTIIGVRDKAMVKFVDGSIQQAGGTFDYRSEINNGGHIIFDEINSLYTQGIDISPYAEAMSEYYQSDVEALYEFQAFLSKTNIRSMDYGIIKVFDFYELYTIGKYEDQPDYLVELLRFGTEHVRDEEIHEKVAERTVDLLQGNVSRFNGEQLTAAIGYISQYTVFLLYSVYEILGEHMKQCLESDNMQEFEDEMKSLAQVHPGIVNDYITWLLSADCVVETKRFLSTQKNDYYAVAYLKFVLNNSNKWSESVYCFIVSVMESMKNKKMLADYIFEWINVKDSDVGETIMYRFIAGSETQALALEIQKRNLYHCENPAEYFWSTYKKYYAAIQEINIGDFIQKYLERNGDIKQIQLIVKRIDKHSYNQYETLRIMSRCIEQHSINDLISELDIKTTACLVQAIETMNQTQQHSFIRMDKLMLVYFGKCMAEDVAAGKLQHISEWEVQGYKLCIGTLGEKEYKQYMTEYMTDFCRGVSAKKDMEYLLCCVCNQSHVDTFFDLFISLGIKRADINRKTRLLGTMCAALIDDRIHGEIQNKLTDRVIKYIKKQNKAEQDMVREQAEKLCENNSNAFFEQLENPGSGIGGRLKGFFKKKN